MSAPNASHKDNFLETVELLANNIGKVVLTFLGLAYLCGFLVLESFFFRIGIHDLNLELLRLRYIQTGMLFLAFPLFVLIPASTVFWIHSAAMKQTKQASLSRLGHVRLSHTVQVLCVGIAFYIFLLLETSEVFLSHLWQMIGLLALIIVPGLLMPNDFGFAATKERPFWRWVLALASVGLLLSMIPSVTQDLWSDVKTGFPYWVFTFALYFYLLGSVFEHGRLLFTGQDKGLIIERTTITMILIFLGTYAFAYRIFPLIPIEKGGGNYYYGNNAQLCFPTGDKLKTIRQISPQVLSADYCSAPVRVIEATDSMIYVALSSKLGNKYWATADSLPAIYSFERSDLALFEYSAEAK